MSDRRPQTVEEAVERVAQAIADLAALQTEAAVDAIRREQTEAAHSIVQLPEVRFWFSTQQAAGYAGRHATTVRRALEAGTLHGSQEKAGSRWRIHVTCLEAWISGQSCSHAEGGGD